MNHEMYLSRVLDKLEKASKELEEKMELRRAEISKMQEYFWESYTEYDEWGYEKYDNDRAFPITVSTVYPVRKVINY